MVIGVGAFDAHMGAVGAEIEPYAFVRIIGTSTCDILMAPINEIGHRLIRGICGQVDGSVAPGMLGLEAGQSAFGDLYAWFARLLTGPVRDLLGDEAADTMAQKLIPHLSQQAEQLPVTENDLIALDWINGRRTPNANHTLKAAISGLNLGTNAATVFKALVEATAFGSRSIVDRFIEEGVPIRKVIAIGGVAKKSPFVNANAGRRVEQTHPGSPVRSGLCAGGSHVCVCGGWGSSYAGSRSAGNGIWFRCRISPPARAGCRIRNALSEIPETGRIR